MIFMNIIISVNNEKIKCDKIIIISLIIGIVFLLISSPRLLILSFFVYPFSSLFLVGLYNVYRSFFIEIKTQTKILRFIQAIIYLALSTFMLVILFSFSNITLNYIIYLLTIPIFFIGFAAILKGLLVGAYSSTYRTFNIFIGVVTIIINVLTLYIVDFFFSLSLISLISLLLLNAISRSCLYLSEFGLSILNLKNLKYVIYAMNHEMYRAKMR